MMKRTLTFLAAALFALSAAPAGALEPQLGAFHRVVIPTSANVGGLLGTFYRTRVSILNVTNDTYPIQVTLYGGAGQAAVTTIPMSPGQVRTYENILHDLFSFSGAGALVFDSVVSGRDFAVTAEVFNDKPGCGRFKTVVTGGPLLEPSLPGFDSFSLGVLVDGNNRTNIGIFNDANSENTVTIDVYSASSSNPVATLTRTVGPKTWNQFGLADVTVVGGYVRYRVTDAAFIWAVTVSNDSGDGTFFPAADVIR